MKTGRAIAGSPGMVGLSVESASVLGYHARSLFTGNGES
jgi:hypothetical protein